MIVWKKSRLESKRGAERISIIPLITLIKYIELFYKGKKYLHPYGTNGETELLEQGLWLWWK